jgi:hypothetical protein
MGSAVHRFTGTDEVLELMVHRLSQARPVKLEPDAHLRFNDRKALINLSCPISASRFATEAGGVVGDSARRWFRE